MARHVMGPGDLRLVRWAEDVQLSEDGGRVAWCETALDLERDEPVSNIMVTATDGSGRPRRFTDGPHDLSPRWSPDGHYLAYLCASGGSPALHLAPLEGGTPIKVDSPGAVLWIEWSPTGDRLILVVKIHAQAEDADPRARNAPRVIRGLSNRLDGEGWSEGRRHLFVYDVDKRALRQLSSGDYDHLQPSWSPDGSTIVFVSDRSSRRDDYSGRGDVWTIAAKGGRPRRLAGGLGDAAFPTFSPDGTRVAFTGLAGGDQQAGRDGRLFVVDADGTSEPERLVPGLDLPVGFTFSGKPYVWLTPEELVFAVADGGTVDLRRARLGPRSARAVVSGEMQVAGVAVSGPGDRRVLGYASAWADSPAEAFCLDLGKRTRSPVQVSHANDELRRSVELLPTERFRARASDGLEIEYFVIRPRRSAGVHDGVLPPLFLEIHGGPHLYNPISEIFTSYQSLAGAGYLVVLPNPRGSIGYGEQFTGASRGDWGGADFEDLMACADDVIDRGLADPKRQFVGGYSYGGFMSAWAVGQTTRFKAATVGAPVIDHVSQFGTSDVSVYFADAMEADPWDPPQRLESCSPLSYVPKVETPVFLYVNEGDLRCPPGQADEFYVALKWLRKKVEYVRYPGGSHISFFPMAGAPSQGEDRQRRIIEFLGRHGGVPVEHLEPHDGAN